MNQPPRLDLSKFSTGVDEFHKRSKELHHSNISKHSTGKVVPYSASESARCALLWTFIAPAGICIVDISGGVKEAAVGGDFVMSTRLQHVVVVFLVQAKLEARRQNISQQRLLQKTASFFQARYDEATKNFRSTKRIVLPMFMIFCGETDCKTKLRLCDSQNDVDLLQLFHCIEPRLPRNSCLRIGKVQCEVKQEVVQMLEIERDAAQMPDVKQEVVKSDNQQSEGAFQQEI